MRSPRNAQFREFIPARLSYLNQIFSQPDYDEIHIFDPGCRSMTSGFEVKSIWGTLNIEPCG
jgi:hypothetical protein